MSKLGKIAASIALNAVYVATETAVSIKVREYVKKKMEKKNEEQKKVRIIENA